MGVWYLQGQIGCVEGNSYKEMLLMQRLKSLAVCIGVNKVDS